MEFDISSISATYSVKLKNISNFHEISDFTKNKEDHMMIPIR